MYTRKAQTGLTVKKQQEAKMKAEKKAMREMWQLNITPNKGYVAVSGVLFPY